MDKVVYKIRFGRKSYHIVKSNNQFFARRVFESDKIQLISTAQKSIELCLAEIARNACDERSTDA
jgi:hypothetical protein